MIFLNFKTYKSGSGDNALSMAKIAEETSRESGIKINSIVQVIDIKEISSVVTNEVWSQNVDDSQFGAHTGSVLAETLIENGATGVIINHSENRSLNFNVLSTEHHRAKEVGLKTLIFAKDLEELQKVSELKPDFISYEPPSLIGSKDKSVASAEPDIISKASEISKKTGIPLIVGAGVHSSEDVKTCLNLGAVGIAVSSDIMNAEDPKKELLKLVSGFNG